MSNSSLLIFSISAWRVLNRFWGATIVFLDQVSKEPVVVK